MTNPKYTPGQILYHKASGRPVVIRSHAGDTYWIEKDIGHDHPISEEYLEACYSPEPPGREEVKPATAFAAQHTVHPRFSEGDLVRPIGRAIDVTSKVASRSINRDGTVVYRLTGWSGSFTDADLEPADPPPSPGDIAPCTEQPAPPPPDSG